MATSDPSRDSNIRMCVDRFVPEHRRSAASVAALAERSDNLVAEPLPPGSGPSRMALLVSTLWEPGRQLRVRFVDGEPEVQKKVAEIAHVWSDHANITFAFDQGAEADIRVSFAHEGSWSYLGIVAGQIDSAEPTMNYGWLTPDTDDVEYSRVVLHEFGHALGCIHEHQSPDVSIPWDKEAVYAYYARQGWSRTQVDSNLFRAYGPEGIRNSRFDRESIMLYAVDNALTSGDWEVGWNTDLSEADMAFIASQYPFEPKPANELVVGGEAVEAGIGVHGEIDAFTFTVEQAGPYLIETQGDTDVVVTLFGPDSDTTLAGFDDDSGAGFNARIERLLTPGRYQVKVRHWRPTGTGNYAVGVRPS